MKNKIIYILSILFTILFILWIILMKWNAVAKQEPIQELLNQIQTNEEELKNLEIRQNELNEANEQAKQRLLNDYWLQITENIDEVIEEDRMPWKLNEDWTAQEMPDVEWSDSHERFKSLASKYWLDASMIRQVENHYWIKEWVILCITVAETSWWNRGAWWKNIWSVWSNDRGDRPTFALMESWLEAIWKTLTNQYLWKIQTLWCLSNRHHCESRDDRSYRYATSSPETTWAREPNMIACLSQIYWSIDPATFRIRR